MATNRRARGAARVFNEAVEIPPSDAGSGSDEEEEDEDSAVGAAATAAASDDDDDDEDDDEEVEAEAWETESFFRDALGDGSAPVVFEPRELRPRVAC